MQIRIKSAAAAANAALYVAILLFLLQRLLLAAAVRHRVPDGKICAYGSLHLISLFLFIQTRLFSMYSLAVLSHFQHRFFYL